MNTYDISKREIHKHDLSANTVKFDYGALISTAASAVRLAGDSVDRYRRDFLDCMFTHSPSSMVGATLTAGYLAEAAKQLAVATDTYYALLAMQNREIAEIVNRPAIVED